MYNVVYITLFWGYWQVQEFEGKETALLIDRYKYLDLLPCSENELRAIGYMVSNMFHFLKDNRYL